MMMVVLHFKLSVGDDDDDGGATFGVGYQQQPEVTEIERQGKGKTPKLQTDTKAGGRPY